MNYELVKKLKEAGFPTVTRWEIENNHRRPLLVKGEALPPLGGLLAEVGDLEIVLHFAHWNNPDNKGRTKAWRAWIVGDDFHGDYHRANKSEGSTPEEAVANLWLALQANTPVGN